MKWVLIYMNKETEAYRTAGSTVVWGDLLARPVSDRFLSSTSVTALHRLTLFIILFIQLPPSNLEWRFIRKSFKDFQYLVNKERTFQMWVAWLNWLGLLTAAETEHCWEVGASGFPLSDTTLHCSPGPPRSTLEKSEFHSSHWGRPTCHCVCTQRSSAYSEGPPGMTVSKGTFQQDFLISLMFFSFPST